jgi:hypothetical protein
LEVAVLVVETLAWLAVMAQLILAVAAVAVLVLELGGRAVLAAPVLLSSDYIHKVNDE